MILNSHLRARVVLEGWPSAIFLDTDPKYIEEFSTRNLTVTPECSEGKIEEANKLTNVQASYPWEYEEETEDTKVIRGLIAAIKNQLVENRIDVVVPFENLYELFPKEIARARELMDTVKWVSIEAEAKEAGVGRQGYANTNGLTR